MRIFRRLGFGIQSPWAYELVTNVLYGKSQYYAFPDLRSRYPDHVRRGEQLFRLVNHLRPATAAIICDGSATATLPVEAMKAYMTAARKDLAVQVLNTTPACRFDIILVVTPTAFRPDEWLASHLHDDSTCMVVEDIRHEGKALWERLTAEPQVTASFDIRRRRGIAFFDIRRIKAKYKI